MLIRLVILFSLFCLVSLVIEYILVIVLI